MPPSAATGDPRNFNSIDHVLKAFKKQLEFFNQQAAICLNTEALVHEKIMPVPFL
ncbi:unnamed protein product, partial [marine sediment metagenome]